MAVQGKNSPKRVAKAVLVKHEEGKQPAAKKVVVRGKAISRPKAASIAVPTIDALAHDIAGLGVWDWNIARDTTTWNDNHYRLLGYVPGEVEPSYERWLERVHPDDRDRVSTLAKSFLAKGTTSDTEYRVRWPDGTVRFMREQGVIMRDARGAATRYYGVMMDVTGPRQAEMFGRALDALHQIIHGTHDTDAIFRAVMDEGMKGFDCDSAFVALWRNHRWVVTHAWGVTPAITGTSYAVDDLPGAVRATQTGVAQPVDDVARMEGAEQDCARALNHVLSYLVIPLVIRKEPLGVVYFNFTRAVVKFDPSHLAMAAALASSVSLAVERAQLFATLQEDIESRARFEHIQRQAHDRLELIADAASALLQSNQPLDVIKRICRRAIGYLNCEMYFNYILDEKTRRLRLISCEGFPGHERAKIEWLSVGEGADGYAAQESTPTIIQRVPSSSDLRIRLLKSHGLRAYASYPLMNNSGALLGTLSFGTTNRDAFSEEDVALMQSLANHVAAALDRTKSREAIRRSEARYHALFRNMGEGFALLDVMYDGQGQPADYRFVDVNHSFEKITGQIRDHLIGRSVLDFLLPGQIPVLARYSTVATDGEPARFEYRHEVTDRIFDVYAYRPADHQVAVIIMDVTRLWQSGQREQAALAMAAAAQTAKDALQSMGEGVLLLDMNGKVTSVNHAFEKMIGREGALVEGVFLENLLKDVTPGHAADLIEKINIAIRGEEVSLAGFDLIDVAGNRTPVFPAVSFIRDQQNEPTAVIFSLRDISDIKKAERDREQYEAKLKQLARELAATEDRARHRIAGQIHDTVIQTLSLSNIKLGLVRNKLAEASLETLVADVGGVRTLLTEAINESRALMAELTPPLLHELGLLPALRDLAERLQKLHGKTITVRDNEPSKMADKGAERIVFRATRELIMNSLKHAGPCTIGVGVWNGDGHLHILVEDDGSGFTVPADNHFMCGQQGGFGLFSINERLEILGGELFIRSKPGQGTRAEMVVPLDANGG